MSAIVIFKEITTEESLLEIEKSAAKYDGLYCDMSNKEERKFVKDQAEFIGTLIKKLDRSRIDQSKNFKFKVEKEAKYINERLAEANKPFTLLLDEWKAERKAILDAEKAVYEAKEAAIKFLADFDEALMMNKVYDFELKEKLAYEQIQIEKIRLKAVQDAKDQIEREAQQKIEEARLDAEREKMRLQDDIDKKIEEARQAEIAAKINAAKVERDRNDAIRQAELDKQQAVIDAENKARGEANRIEINRLAEIDKKARIEADAKAANVEHQKEVNNSILDCLKKCGASDDVAKSIIKAAAKHQIEFLTINY